MGEAFDINALSSYWFALSRDCPGKTWWRAKANHPLMFEALRISAEDGAAIYACAPFRAIMSEQGPRVLAAYPAPRLFDEPDYHWLGIDTVISWNPQADTAEVLGDTAPQIVGNLSDETNVIFASPRAFFQQWARRRAQFLTHRQQASSHQWNKPPVERDEVPGVLMIGAPADIRWRPHEMPSEIQCSGVNPAIINREMLKAARVPRAFGGAQ